MVDMQHKQNFSGSCASIALPSATRFSEVSSSLAEKLAQQIEWMRKRGISIKLEEDERPEVEEKNPLPGTVLYFSDEP